MKDLKEQILKLLSEDEDFRRTVATFIGQESCISVFTTTEWPEQKVLKVTLSIGDSESTESDYY